MGWLLFCVKSVNSHSFIYMVILHTQSHAFTHMCIYRHINVHTWVTVSAGTDIGIPAPKAASLAMFDVRHSWITGKKRI
jgi:hypothetical protein